MGKPNRNKNAQNASSSEMKINEPEFDEKPDTKNLSAGAKKLLLQQEKDRRDQEEADRIIKEKLEADKKKKKDKTPNKAKPKPTPSKNKEEGKPEPKPINTRNENEVKGEHIRQIQKPKYPRNENADFEKTPKPKNTQHEDEGFNEATKAEHIQNENEGNDSLSQEYSSISNEPDEAWNWTGNKSNLSNESCNLRDDKKREIGKPNHSHNRQSGNFGNSSFGRSSFGYTFSDGKNDEEFQKFYNDKQNFHGKVREVKGDLFDAPEEYSLAHCVAEDFSMGAGIAKEFKARFRRVAQLFDQNAKTGGLAVLDDKDRFIYYLVTKQVSRGKPTLYTLWKSLLNLRDHITENKVTKLAIPQIGCGLDRLDWIDVKRMLEYVFSKTPIDIVVYILDFNLKKSRSNNYRHNNKNKHTQPLIPSYLSPSKTNNCNVFNSNPRKRKYNQNLFSHPPGLGEISLSPSKNRIILDNSQGTRKSYSNSETRPVYREERTNYESKPAKISKLEYSSSYYKADHFNTCISSDSETSHEINSNASGLSKSSLSPSKNTNNFDNPKETSKSNSKYKTNPKYREKHAIDERKINNKYNCKSDSDLRKLLKSHKYVKYSDCKKSNKNEHKSDKYSDSDRKCRHKKRESICYSNNDNSNNKSLQVSEINTTFNSTQNNESISNNSDMEIGKYKKDESKREETKEIKKKKSKHSKSKKNKKRR